MTSIDAKKFLAEWRTKSESAQSQSQKNEARTQIIRWARRVTELEAQELSRLAPLALRLFELLDRYSRDVETTDSDLAFETKAILAEAQAARDGVPFDKQSQRTVRWTE